MTFPSATTIAYVMSTIVSTTPNLNTSSFPKCLPYTICCYS